MSGELNERLRLQLKSDGFCIMPKILAHDEITATRTALVGAAEAMRKHGGSTHTKSLDPNERNVRVYNLPEVSPIFADLLRHPLAVSLAKEILGQHVLVSNFTANIALPGSRPMRLHADQALVIPPPWNQPWAMNVIWCLDDVHERNGATRYLPGSHRYTTFEEVPTDADRKTLPFEAPAGSLIAMEGRLWHTSGANVSENEERAMLFAYYTVDFIRPQVNWEATLSGTTKAQYDAPMRELMGLGPAANIRIGAQLTRLPSEAAP